MSKATCELKWCKSGDPGEVRVTENFDDGAWTTWICKECRRALGMVEGDDLPTPDNVRKVLKDHYKEYQG